MKITAEKNDLLEVTLPAAGFASNKSTIASTEGILFRTTSESSCDICAYDLEKGLKPLSNVRCRSKGVLLSMRPVLFKS